MDRRTPPDTDEGWYALHDLRTIDWDAWGEAAERDRDRAVEAGVDFLEAAEAVEDADEGQSAVYSVLGHKADLLLVHLRPTLADVERLERRFERTEFARFTEQTSSYVSVTEASGYSERAREYFEGEVDDDSSLAKYIRGRLHPEIPDAGYVSFYPMSKRRDPEQNWYDLPFEERAEHMERHGNIGRQYGGKVEQMISGSIGLDDYEWGVTLWADDMTDVKDLLYEMRFDPSSSKFAEFGPFYTGKRFAPSELGALLAGDPVGVAVGDEGDGGDPVREEIEGLGVDLGDAAADAHGLVLYSDADVATVREEVDGLRGNFEHYDSHVLTEVVDGDAGPAVVSVWRTESAADTASGFLEDLPGVDETVRGSLSGAGERSGADAGGGAGADAGEGDGDGGDGGADDDDIRGELADVGVYAGQPHGEDVYALVLYSEADPEELAAEVEELRGHYTRYDSHVKTAVYEGAVGEGLAVASIWTTQSAADKAADSLSDLPGIVRQAGDDGESWGTMGMFYTVKSEYREDFVEKFETVGGLLADTDGHRETTLLANREDDTDMFIASRWDAREDAMAFFRSDEFSETVDWGRDVLADRPRHVFLA